jgi:hypothetical protein
LRFHAGSDWEYSNAGYHVLGFICSAVGGEDFSVQLTKRVFGPATMRTARLVSESEIIPNRAAGYRLEDGQLRNQTWIAPSLNTTADGGLYMSVMDIAAWDAALQSDSILSTASKQAMWQPTTLPDGTVHAYGFGWRLNPTNGHRTVKHSGDWQGFSAHISRYLDDGLTVVVMTNLTGADPERIARRIAAEFEPALALSRRAAIPDTNPEATARVREVLMRTADGTVNHEWFSSRAQARLFPGRIEEARGLFSSLGAMTSIEVIERQPERQGIRTEYRIGYAKRTIALDVTTTADGLIDVVTAEIE